MDTDDLISVTSGDGEAEGINPNDQQRAPKMLSDTAHTFLRWATAMQADVAARQSNLHQDDEAPSDDIGDDLVNLCSQVIAKVVLLFQKFDRLVCAESSLSQALSDLVHKNLACFRNLIQVEQILCNVLSFASLCRQSFPAASHPAVLGNVRQPLDSAQCSDNREMRQLRGTVEQCVQYVARRLTKIRTRLDDICEVITRVATNGDARQRPTAHSTRLQILFLELEEKIRLIALDSGECERKIDETQTRIKIACDQMHFWTPEVVAFEMLAGIVTFSVGLALQKFCNLSPKCSILAGVFAFVAASAFVLNSKRQSATFKKRFEEHMKIKDYRRYLI